jgi:hypothetical protein
MKTIEKKVALHTPAREVKEVRQVVTFRAKPSEIQYWNEKAKKLGVKDFSAFIRGSLNSAIYVSQRAQDPAWQKFVEAVQPIAKKFLGFGFYDGGAKDFESSGTEYKTTSAKEYFARLKKKNIIP